MQVDGDDKDATGGQHPVRGQVAFSPLHRGFSKHHVLHLPTWDSAHNDQHLHRLATGLMRLLSSSSAGEQAYGCIFENQNKNF